MRYSAEYDTMDLFADIKVIYEDEDVLVIDKPAGLIVHDDGRMDEPTVAQWLLKTHPELRNVGEPATLLSGEVIERPGIVHRIDRETSGVLIVAKNQKAFLFLKNQFQDRKTEKIYNAFAYGIVAEEDGMIDKPIGRSKGDFRRWSVRESAAVLSAFEKGAFRKGKRMGRMSSTATNARANAREEEKTFREALTYYRVLVRSNEHNATYLEVRPKTGRTHQIRVHLKAIDHPVVCDSLYAPNRPALLGFARTALHARSLTITLPGRSEMKGERKTFEALPPPDFQNALSLFMR